MKKIKVLFAMTFVTVMLLTSCTIYTSKDFGPEKTQKYDLKDFTALDVSAVDYVTFVQDSVYSVEIKGTEMLLDKLTVSVSADSTLQITGKDALNLIPIVHGSITVQSEPMTEAIIHAPSLKAVSMAGSVSFEAQSPLVSPSFSVSVAGSGDIKIPSITCEEFEGKIAGSGDMQTKVLQATTTQLKIAGSGDMLVDFDNCQAAIVSISGSGDITLRGTLGTLQQDVAGSGEISTSGLQLNAYKPQSSNP